MKIKYTVSELTDTVPISKIIEVLTVQLYEFPHLSECLFKTLDMQILLNTTLMKATPEIFIINDGPSLSTLKEELICC